MCLQGKGSPDRPNPDESTALEENGKKIAECARSLIIAYIPVRIYGMFQLLLASAPTHWYLINPASPSLPPRLIVLIKTCLVPVREGCAALSFVSKLAPILDETNGKYLIGGAKQ